MCARARVQISRFGLMLNMRLRTCDRNMGACGDGEQEGNRSVDLRSACAGCDLQNPLKKRIYKTTRYKFKTHSKSVPWRKGGALV